MSIEDDIAFLSRVPTFAKFGYAALQIVAIGSETRHLVDGEVLFRAGEATDAGYVIQEGLLQLTTHDPRLAEPTLTFGPGTLIGELALLTETVCAATAVAAEPAAVIRISRNLFRKVLEGFPEPARLMRERLAARVNQSTSELSRVRAVMEKLGERNTPGGDGRPQPGRTRS